MPAVGNQPSAVAKTTRRIIPNRKYGIEYRISEMPFPP